MAGETAAEHEAGIRASQAWYDDVFAVHGTPTRSDEALWWALAEPPPWHSAAKTLRRAVAADRVLRAVEPFEHCSVADSYGTLDLAPAGFQRLLVADWLHREAPSPEASLPDGWGVVTEPVELARWNEQHDYTGVLRPAFLEHPHFTVLARHESSDPVGGAVLHEAGATVELSNAWAAEGGQQDVAAMVACAAVLHPGRPLVGYAHGTSWAGGSRPDSAPPERTSCGGVERARPCCRPREGQAKPVRWRLPRPTATTSHAA